MRVIAGSAKGHVLKGPRGEGTRPTADKVKGAIFSMIESQLARLYAEDEDVWEGRRVLDLYAGTGALGIEALSRGAAWADFVDASTVCGRLIHQNLERTRLAGRARVHCVRAERAVGTPEVVGLRSPYELALLDAPYGDPGLASVVDALAASSLLAERAAVVVEHSRRHELPDRFGRLVRVRQRRYGDTIISVYVQPGELATRPTDEEADDQSSESDD